MNTEYGLDEDEAGMEAARERLLEARESGTPMSGAEDLDALDARLDDNWQTVEAPTPVTGVMRDADATPAEPPKAEPEPSEPPKEPWARIEHGLRENDTRVPAESTISAKMKSVGWEPKPAEEKAGRPGWDQLQADLQAAERHADSQKATNAMLHAAAPGFTGPSDAGQGGIDAARAAIMGHEKLLAESRQQDLDATTAKKAALDQERERQQIDAAKATADTAAKARLVAEAKEQAENDTGSVESKRARDGLRPVFEMTGHVPEDFEQWTAKQVKEFAKTLSPIAVGADRRKKTDAELAAKAKTTTEADTSLEGERAVLAADKRLLKLGYTPESIAKLDRHGIDEASKKLAKLKGGTGTGTPIHITAGDISTVPERRPGHRNLVEAIAAGRAPAPTPGARFGADLLGDVLAYKPDADLTRYGAYKKVTEQQATGKDVIAIDVALEHLGTARKLIPPNADVSYVNKVKQAIASGTGDAEFKPFIAASSVAAHELAKVYGIEDQAGKEMVEHQLSAAQSPAQLAAVFDTFIELIKGKQAGLAHQRERVAPTSSHGAETGETKDHGEVVKETKSFKQYKDGFIEKKKAE